MLQIKEIIKSLFLYRDFLIILFFSYISLRENKLIFLTRDLFLTK